MLSRGHRRNRIAVWFETTRRPGLVLVGLVFLLYGRTLGWGFVLDDHRLLYLLEEYHEGTRESLGLYRFLVSDESNRQARVAGWYAWWMGDDLRYQHWRPVTERSLYAQYMIFGARPFGYRLVSLLLYSAGVCLVLALFRVLGRDERLARWSALVFAVMAGHTIPVVFISAQSDVWALVLCSGAMLAAAYFVRDGRWWYLVVSAFLYLTSLGSKEACLPAAVLPACFALLTWDRSGASRRALGSSAFLVSVGMVWLGFYISGDFGANNSLMLDPVHAPLEYLSALPERALALLSSLLIPVNPFLFYIFQSRTPWLAVYCVMGVIALFLFGRVLWRHHRRQRGIAMFALWILPFIPLLVCTTPDDRVMVLPSIGFAYLVGALMTRLGPQGAARLRSVPLVLFVFVHVVFALTVSQVMRAIELDTKRSLRTAIEGFGRELAPGDCVFFVNDTLSLHVLFVQYCFEEMVGRRGMTVAFLSDVAEPVVSRVDSHTLRIGNDDEGLLSGFLGAMGTSRNRPKREGDEFEAGELTGRIVKVSEGVVREVELRFRKPLGDDSYRFYWRDSSGGLRPWEVPPAQQGSLAHYGSDVAD
ncbi:MAG: hypothetical protein MI923_25065 [Phycisphaerales bacterium]|nr:hypothetical protein [Phycisphaerales bacterium]